MEHLLTKQQEITTMFRKDFLEKQLEQIGLVVTKLLSDLLPLKNQNNTNLGLEKINEVLKGEFDLSLQTIRELNITGLLDYLTATKNFKAGHLDLLADTLHASIDFAKPEEQKILCEKVLLIFEHVNQLNKTYSSDRQQKINNLNKHIYELK